MTAAEIPEYRTLERESSNDMIRYESLCMLGEHAEALEHILRAGESRHQMGQMMFELAKYAYAAEDWLSAAACFQLARNVERMKSSVERVDQLLQQATISTSGHIRDSLNQRLQELAALEQELLQIP